MWWCQWEQALLHPLHDTVATEPWTGSTGEKQLGGGCSRPLFHLCSPEWVKQNFFFFFFLKQNVQTYSWNESSNAWTVQTLIGVWTEISPAFCSPLCCCGRWRLSYHCNRYGVSWLRRTWSKTLTGLKILLVRCHPSEGSYWAKTQLWREINSNSMAQMKWAEDFRKEEPGGDRVQTRMNGVVDFSAKIWDEYHCTK